MKKINNHKGFSLIELLIVMAIMGLLASLVAPELFGRVEQSKVRTAQAQMKLLSTSLDAYRLDVGEYPESIAELQSSEKIGWMGPYLEEELPLDPWNVAYSYKRLSTSKYQLTSLGADKKPGGEGLDADIIHN